jgi:hypothetical protein
MYLFVNRSVVADAACSQSVNLTPGRAILSLHFWYAK